MNSTVNDSQALYVSNLGYQAIGLNRVNSNIDELQTGVYHCEMMDKKDVTWSLFVGIYQENEGIHTNAITISIKYR